MINELHMQVVAQIGASQATRGNKLKREKGPKDQAGRTRKRKRYRYARKQKLVRKNPILPLRYIREGASWLELGDSSSNKSESGKSFYKALWGKIPNITIPFTAIGSGHIARDICEEFQESTARDINERLNHTRQNIVSVPNLIERKRISGLDVKEVLQILFNIILVSKIGPKAWNTNRTILIAKQGKNRSRVEYYRSVTISSLVCRTFCGTVDKKLRNVIFFSPRQKCFVHDTGCFNNVHILIETIKAAKVRNGLLAIQLDIDKPFDTVPHKDIEEAMKRLGLPKVVRESIMQSYKDLSTIIEYIGSRTEPSLMRAVKQGDPNSPIGLNAIMEPLLEQYNT